MKKHIVISSDGPGPFSTRVSTVDGDPILGMRNATVSIRAGEPTTAEMEILTAFTGEAEATFTVVDPTSGKKKPVERIQFTDGTTWPTE